MILLALEYSPSCPGLFLDSDITENFFALRNSSWSVWDKHAWSEMGHPELLLKWLFNFLFSLNNPKMPPIYKWNHSDMGKIIYFSSTCSEPGAYQWINPTHRSYLSWPNSSFSQGHSRTIMRTSLQVAISKLRNFAKEKEEASVRLELGVRWGGCRWMLGENG